MDSLKKGLLWVLMLTQVWQPVLAEVISSQPQTTTDRAQNGVPVVNIATPNAAGVSHNRYSEFNVDAQGVILNNSTSAVNTQLGGYVLSNEHLTNGSARLILNEVNSLSSSQLNGYMEVAGQRAEVVVANPLGISCKGCGFINTSRGTLTTGVPVMGADGNLLNYQVSQGLISIEGAGLNASNTDQLNLFGRALALNADIYAQEFNAALGVNSIDANTGAVVAGNATDASPNFAIDASALGGMYANRIRLIGTEAGVGMRLAAPVAAMNGDVEILANGDVRLVKASATERLSITTTGSVDVAADSALTSSGVSSGKTLSIQSGNALTLASGVALNGQDISLTALSLNADAGSDIAARKNLFIKANEQQLAGDIGAMGRVMMKGSTITQSGNLLAGTGLVLIADALTNSGNIGNQAGDVAITLTGALDNHSASLQSAGALVISAQSLSNQAGTIAAGSARLIVGDVVNNRDGTIRSNTDLTLNATSLNNQHGIASANTNADVTLGDNGLDNRNGVVSAQGRMTIAAPSLTNLGILYGKSGLNLWIEGALNNGEAASVSDANAYVPAVIYSEGSIRIQNAAGGMIGDLNNYGGFIESTFGNITIKSERLNNINIGWALAAEYKSEPSYLYLNQYGDTSSQLAWNSYNLGFTREHVDVIRYRDIITHRDVQSQGNRGYIVAGMDIDIAAIDIVNNRSTISAANNLVIQASTLTNEATHLQNTRDREIWARYHTCYRKHAGDDKDCYPRDKTKEYESDLLPEDVGQTIKAIIEAGGTVTLNAEIVKNGEAPISGNTSVIRGEGYPQETGNEPWNQAPTNPINQGIIDPTALPGFHLPNGGLFQKAAPGHGYLIETNPVFNTYAGFAGSAYLLSRLDWAPEVTQRRLGDSYYEIMLIREALQASLGSRFINRQIADERTQYEYLMNNAIAAASDLQLSPGIRLTQAQISALQTDIVWMEEKVIFGEKVLVPVVYLANGAARVQKDGAVIAGGDVELYVDELINNAIVAASGDVTVKADASITNRNGTIRAGENLALISGGDINNISGKLSGQNVSLDAAGDINNVTWSENTRSGTKRNGSWSTTVGDTATITATGTVEQRAGGDINNISGKISGHNVSLAAAGDINNVTWSEKITSGTKNNVSWSTTVGDTATITASGSVEQRAGGDITMVGADVQANTVRLQAGGDVNINALKVEQGSRYTRKNYRSINEQVRYLGSQISALQELQIEAGGNITAIASDLSAGASANLKAGGDIALLAAEERDYRETYIRKDGSFGKSSSTTTIDEKITQKGSTLSVGRNNDNAAPGNVNLQAGRDVQLHASAVTATGDTVVEAGRDIAITAGVDSTLHSVETRKKNAVKFKNHQEGFIEQSAAESTLASGGKLFLKANNTVRVTGSTVAAGETLRVGDDTISGGALSAASSGTPQNVFFDTLTLHNETWNETQSGLNGPLKSLVKGLAYLAANLPVSLALAPFKKEIKVGEYNSTRTTTDIQAGSYAQAKNLELNAQDTVMLTAATVKAKTATISANDIVLNAAQNTQTTTHSEGEETVKSLGMKLGKDELRVAGVEARDESLTETETMVQWQGTTINADQLILKARHDLSLLNAAINTTGDAELSAGNNLTLSGNEDTITHTSEHKVETTTVSVGVKNAYVDAAYAVKALEEAGKAVKDAANALRDAKAKVDRGELDQSDIQYFEINLAAATANFAQAQIAMAASIAAAAATTATGGFYASGSAQHETTKTTTTSTQGEWKGSKVNVGGNATIKAGNTATIKGSEVDVKGNLALDAKKIDLLAGESHSDSSSKSRTETAGGSVSVNPGGVGGGVNVGLQKSDSTSSGVAMTNTHIKAGSLSSKSEALTLSGAVVQAGDVNVETDKLTVESRQDTYQSKSRSAGGSVGISGGAGGVSGVSASANFQNSDAEKRWVGEQTALVGANSITVSAKDTRLKGGLIANATHNNDGTWSDKGNLTFSTDTLTVEHLNDVDRQKTVGANLSVSVPVNGAKANDPAKGTGNNQPAGATSTTASSNTTKKGVPFNSATVGAIYTGHVTEQTTAATMGTGNIRIGQLIEKRSGDTLNTDLAKAQVITRDQDIGGLNASVTVDGRWFTAEGRAEMLDQQKNLGKNAAVVVTGAALTTAAIGATVLSGDILNIDKAVTDPGKMLGVAKTNGQLARDIQAAQNGETTGVFTQTDTANAVDTYLNEQDPNALRINVTRALADKNGNVIGATYNSANGQMYLSQLNMSDLVNNVAHEGMHAAGAGEFLSRVVGNLSSYAFSVGTWANQGNVNRYSASYNPLDNDAAAQNRRLNSNATRYLFERQTQPTLFDDRALTRRESQAIFEEARALTSGQGEAAQKLMTLRLVSAALKRVDGEYQNNQSAIDDPVADAILNEMQAAPGRSGYFIATPDEYAQDYRPATGDGLEKALDKFNTHIDVTQQAISRQDGKLNPTPISDTLKEIDQQYQVTTRGFGALQAAGGVAVGISSSGLIATGAVTCPATGVGCGLIGVGVLGLGWSADQTSAGVTTAWNGTATPTLGGQLLVAAGMDPAYAEFAYGMGGMVPVSPLLTSTSTTLRLSGAGAASSNESLSPTIARPALASESAEAGQVNLVGVGGAAPTRPLFSGDWDNFQPQGLFQSPIMTPEGRRLVDEIEALSYSRPEAVLRAKQLMETGSTLPYANPIEVGDVFYKLVPLGEGVGARSPFWATESQIQALRGATFDEISNRLGLPLAQQDAGNFSLFKIRAIAPGTSFTSKIAPTNELGANGVLWKQAGGDTQTLLIDRKIFTEPELVEFSFK